MKKRWSQPPLARRSAGAVHADCRQWLGFLPLALRNMKSVVVIFCALVFAIGCSKQSVSSDTSALPQFHIVATDVSTTSVSVVTGQFPANPTQEVALLHITLTETKAGEFQKFTQKYVDQKIQVVVLGKVTIEPVVLQEISSGRLDLPYSTSNQAITVAQSLNTR